MELFKNLSYFSQIRLLRTLALNSLKQYPIKCASLDFIQHGENTTYKITDTKHNKYLLRIHRNGYHTKEAIKEELNWLIKIKKTTDIVAPLPVTSHKKSLIVSSNLNANNLQRNATLLKWVEGRQIKRSVNQSHIKAIAALIAKLHSNTKDYKVTHRRYWSSQGLAGTKPFMGPMNSIVGLNYHQQQILNESRVIVFNKLSKYEKKYPQKMGLIHADLHFGNFFFKMEIYLLLILMTAVLDFICMTWRY